MAAYTALQADESGNYDKVKKAILRHYDVNEETHRRQFRKDRKRSEENYPEWICRLTDHFDKWTNDSTVPLKELIIMEQVLQSVDDELAVWLRETLDELGQLAEDYFQARKRGVQHHQRKGTAEPAITVHQTKPDKTGAKKEEHGPVTTGGRARVNTRGDKQCYHCRQGDT